MDRAIQGSASKANDKQTEDIVTGIRSGEIPMEGQEKNASSTVVTKPAKV